MLPLRVAGERLCCVLSSQWIGEDMFSVGSPPTFLCCLSNALCWSRSCTQHHFFVDAACEGDMIKYRVGNI